MYASACKATKFTCVPRAFAARAAGAVVDVAEDAAQLVVEVEGRG